MKDKRLIKLGVLAILIGLLAVPVFSQFEEAIAEGLVTLTVMNPRAAVQGPKPIPASPRLHSLEGKKIGLINNTKESATLLQPELEKALKELIPTVQLKSWSVYYRPFENKDKSLMEAAKASDGVILLLGD